MSVNVAIHAARPRDTVQVTFVGGGTYEGPPGASLNDFVETAYPKREPPVVAALVDGRLAELCGPVTRDVTVALVDTAMSDGMRIYQRSVTMMLVVAARELFPDARVVVDHSVTHGGFHCQILGRAPFSPEELAQVEARMWEMVAADDAITSERMPTAEARDLFAAEGYEDKARLLAFREEATLVVARLRGVTDYFYGYMAPGTGRLRWFALRPDEGGFVLQLPQSHRPTELAPPQDYPKLMRVFSEYGRWLNILGLEDIGSLNEVLQQGRAREAILVSEALHEKHIADLADAIAARGPAVRIVLIAGPSSSGKTTFARRLAIQLRVNGRRPFALGLDDYFVDRDHTPRDAQGNYDFEALEALNLPLLSAHLNDLLAGRPVQVPHFDFVAGTSQPGAGGHPLAGRRHHRRGDPRPESGPADGGAARGDLSHLCLGVDPAQHRSSQPRPHHRLSPAAPHRAGFPVSRLHRPGYHRAVGQRAGRRGAQHLSVPGKRRYHVQFGALVRTGGAQTLRRAAAHAGAAGYPGGARVAPAAGLSALGAALPAGPGAGQFPAA